MKTCCVHCQKMIEIEDCLNGKEIECPECKKIFTVVPAAEVQKKKVKKKWLIGCLSAFVLIVVAGIFFFLEITKDPIKELIKAAEKGDKDSQYKLALSYKDGDGVDKDYAEAAKWFKKAAEQGHTEAQFLYGLWCDYNSISKEIKKEKYDAFGSQKDIVKKGDAFELFFFCGMYYYLCEESKGMPESFKWYKKAAEQGHTESQFMVAVIYNASENETEALKWCRKAAENGHAASQFLLGYIYRNNEDMKKDPAEIAMWYKKAAEQGGMSAQYSLGTCYEDGYGVKTDLTEAIKWYKKAAEQGHGGAKAALKRLKK